MNGIKPTWILLITRKLTSSASASVRGQLYRHSQLNRIVGSVDQILLGAKISLGRLYRSMPQQQLNLLELATTGAA